MNFTTTANIFEYKFINHFTAKHFYYFYFKGHKNIDTQLILSMLKTFTFLPYFQKIIYYFFLYLNNYSNGPSLLAQNLFFQLKIFKTVQFSIQHTRS